MIHWWVRGLSCKPNIYMSWYRSEWWVRLALWNWFKPPGKIFYWPFQGGNSFVDLLYFFVLCLLCLCMRLFILPCGHLLERLTSPLSFVVSICKFVTFPLVSWVRWGNWLYWFLIVAPFLLCHTVLSVACRLQFNCCEELISWLFCVWCFLVFFITFPYGVLVQVWNAIGSIPGLCLFFLFLIV